MAFITSGSEQLVYGILSAYLAARVPSISPGSPSNSINGTASFAEDTTQAQQCQEFAISPSLETCLPQPDRPLANQDASLTKYPLFLALPTIDEKITPAFILALEMGN